ncbi:LysE family translocator [Salinisphaera hydrothermalis]|uniref:Lysine exporter protein (LysE/YggA) n=1 Tax=Salinisphaera hydrothermalis (strain C41B8) TaxID=1304275 RepID=A0A084IPG3_SALHC|nr:LysE family translocator [Salinisphaera hydrothermalis]KEZ78597.1 lysine exporter protein (LysE/YggA) [Salinisphaera hydrothermalis C41B8]
MFDYSWAHWLTFFGAAFALEIVPGPDLLFIATKTARHGRGHGFAAMFGVWTGALVHVAATVLGLAAILARSAMAFSVIKWMGAAYLVWLGIQALISAQRGNDTSEAPSVPVAPSRWAAYRQGILVDLLNPKVALFFLAFIPQFVVPGAGPVTAQLALHGLLLFVVAGLIEPALILVGDRLMRLLRGRRRLAAWAERGVGAIFIGLGARLALAQR